VTPARQRQRGWAARLALAGLLACLGGIVLAGPATAHADLVSSDPAAGEVLPSPPEQITLTFDDPITLPAGGARLYDAAGATVQAEARSVGRVVTVRPQARMPEGTYVLTYRLVSADSHPIAGSLSFSVGAPSPDVVPPGTVVTKDAGVKVVLGAVQGIAYAALFLAVGLAVFSTGLLPTGSGLEQLRARLHRLVGIAALVAVAGFVALVPVGVLYRQGLSLAGLTTALPWTSWLSVDGLVALVVGLGLALAYQIRDLVGAIGGAVLALGCLPLVGHTRSYGPTWLVVVADLSHVAAASVWFGGLVGLTLSLPSLAGRERLAAVTLNRFSVLAGGLLALVAGAGVVLGWRILGSWQGLVGTPYGLVLLAKVAVVAVVAVVAAWNRYRFLPRLVASAGLQPRRAAADRLRRMARAEAGLLVVVLLTTGFLVNQVPREAPETTRPVRDTSSLSR
jgi:copper transport protein